MTFRVRQPDEVAADERRVYELRQAFDQAGIKAFAEASVRMMRDIALEEIQRAENERETAEYWKRMTDDSRHGDE